MILQSRRFVGRRIEFDYDKFGHSPSCLGSNTNIVNGKEAVVQGYGRAEDGENDRHPFNYGMKRIPLMTLIFYIIFLTKKLDYFSFRKNKRRTT